MDVTTARIGLRGRSLSRDVAPAGTLIDGLNVSPDAAASSLSACFAASSRSLRCASPALSSSHERPRRWLASRLMRGRKVHSSSSAPRKARA